MADRLADRRPSISAVRSAEDLTNWYWTRSELVEIARGRGASTQGNKEVLLQRLVAGVEADAAEESPPLRPAEPRSARSKPSRISPPFSTRTSVPAGQPLTRELRNWLTNQLGRPVRVNQAMRDFMKNPAGGTLFELLELAREPSPRSDIPLQFELNRFMRVLAAERPTMTHSERMAAWREFRQRPASEREQVLDGSHSYFA